MAFDSYTSSTSRLVGSAGGSYHLERVVGTGAIGTVYLARQEGLGREVAIKFLLEPYATDPRFVALLRREARASSRIEHPNVARTYDYGRDQRGRDFLVMEWLRGAPLGVILEKVPRPPLAWSVALMARLLAGVAATHERGVVHRDIKPSNVMVETVLNDDDELVDVPKLCDFGIATIADDEVWARDAATSGLDPNASGTPIYMSPEQAQHQPCTPQSDIYSCGVLLFELVTGRPPFDAPTSQVIAALHVHGELPRPSAICCDIDADLEAIIMRALSKDPQARYASASEMRAALLALPYASHKTSLLDSWADAPTAKRRTVARPVPSRGPRFKPFTRAARGVEARPALATSG